MGTLDAGAAKERVEPVVAAQCGEPIGLDAIAALEHPDDRGFEVVVPDPARYTPEVGKRQHVPLQERLLALTGERDVERSAREHNRMTNIQHFTTSPAIVA